MIVILSSIKNVPIILIASWILLSKGKLEFEIDYSKTDLSAYLNAERPSLSTEISRVCKEGIIENNNRKYKILDLEKLESEM